MRVPWNTDSFQMIVHGDTKSIEKDMRIVELDSNQMIMTLKFIKNTIADTNYNVDTAVCEDLALK